MTETSSSSKQAADIPDPHMVGSYDTIHTDLLTRFTRVPRSLRRVAAWSLACLVPADALLATADHLDWAAKWTEGSTESARQMTALATELRMHAPQRAALWAKERAI